MDYHEKSGEKADYDNPAIYFWTLIWYDTLQNLSAFADIFLSESLRIPRGASIR